MNLTQKSKFLSLILRHDPSCINLTLDQNGWAIVDDLIRLANIKNPLVFNMQIIEEIVKTDSKQRYSFSEDRKKIRANQGHSISVDLELKPISPPDLLYHGTSDKYLSGILKDGIKKMSRQHVHLSPDLDTAFKVGRRHGIPKILVINTKKMHEDKVLFYKSENGIYLTDFVDPKYIKLVVD
jgi:putative RNA 2'-phosphotransferase